MKEVADWLRRPENRDEFLIILLDDQLNLANWVKPQSIARGQSLMVA